MWNQWAAGAPPIPPLTTGNQQQPLIGPVQPTATAPPSSDTAPHPTGTPTYSSSSGAPSYTPAQYAAMTPEQQYAVQQHWQQWQAYEQQYAQWHAQYGEQYKREMAAIHAAPPPTIPQYGNASVQATATNSYTYPPPTVSNSYQGPQASVHAPPPPPPDDNQNAMGIKAPPQIYEQPPPPPPPPQQEEKEENRSESFSQFQGVSPVQVGSAKVSQFTQNQDSRWSQPPPPMQNKGGPWDESISQGRTQQNQYNQLFNDNNSHGKPQTNQSWDQMNRNEQGHDNRQSNDFRGRTRGRGGNKFDNRQQQFDDSQAINNRQQEWQRSDRSGQRNSRGGLSRFDNYEPYNKNTSQNSGQQYPAGWNNSNQMDNSSFGNHQRPQQHHQHQSNSVEDLKNNSGSVDEKAFDEQFRLWEEQFENWKKENANHPDRTMYMQYEREFEKTRTRLLERREQMRRRKITELQQVKPQQINQSQRELQNERPCLNIDQQRADHQTLDPKENEQVFETKENEHSDMEQSENEDTSSGNNRNQIASTAVLQVVAASKEVDGIDANIFKNKEITELFKTADGIPGLDLVKPKEDDKIGNADTDGPDPEIIDLDNDGPTRPAKVTAISTNIVGILPSAMKQSVVKSFSPDHLQQSITSSKSQGRKIPSLFDIVVEKPILSPHTENQKISPVRDHSPTGSMSPTACVASGVVDSRSRSISKDRDILASPCQRPSSQLSSMSQCQQHTQNNPEGSTDHPFQQSIFNMELQQPINLPPQAADLAKALQDPNVMQLLTVALAQAQQAGEVNQGGNLQQNQLLQQLQQLRPLLQRQPQDRNSNNQPWNSSQPQRLQPWQIQDQNSNTNATINSTQNRSAWSGNPFSRNGNQSFNRGHVSGNESENNNDMQQRNPHNPFRRSIGGNGNDGNCGGNTSFGGDFENVGGHGTFNNANIQGAFVRPGNVSQQRGANFSGGGRFDNNRPHSNFGISPGFRINTNSFGGLGGDDNDYYRPAQVFDYQNRSRADAIAPAAKVVDYGHRPSTAMSTNCFDRDNSEFVPVKTIDYGHASNSVQNDHHHQQKKANFSKEANIHSFQEQQTHSHGLVQSHLEKLKYETSSLSLQNEIRQHNTQNKQQQKKNQNELTKQGNVIGDDVRKELIELEQNESLIQLEDENVPIYPSNKWILQNPNSRLRAGPPTKRGKRNSGRFRNRRKLDISDYTNTECEEIEENFEEISDNEDLNEINDVTPAITQLKAKSQPLFPSVSYSLAKPAMVFPSMENNNTIPVDEILFKPGRLTRPKNIVIIIRGPPGSGKSHVAKLIKDKEIEMGGPTPRLLSIDDYFMIENDYEEKCPKTGRKIPKKEILYEYEKEMEDTYMQYLIKSFKKTITDHLFDFIIVDCCNQSLRTFNEFYNAARDGNFSPFIIDMICDVDICLNQNIHNRKADEIKEIIKNYQDCPGHYIKLDVSNLVENVVEMEDVSDLEDNFAADSVVDFDEEDEANDNDGGGFLKSKWDTDPTTENLARLDGTSKPISKRGTATLEEYLQIDGWEPPSSSTNGKKRVRWADIEEKRAQDKMRAIGFVVGQTDWNRMMDPTSGSGALTKTKYIERLNKRR